MQCICFPSSVAVAANLSGASPSLSLALHQLRKYTPRVPTRLDTHLPCRPKAVPLETKVGTLSMDTNYANIHQECPPD